MPSSGCSTSPIISSMASLGNATAIAQAKMTELQAATTSASQPKGIRALSPFGPKSLKYTISPIPTR